MTYASIPSPSEGVWEIGPFPLRAYALCIIAGIIVAVFIGERRLRARGGEPHVLADVAIWAVPFGIVGGRLYHVLTSWEPYFGPGGEPIRALYVWQGGLGIWGAIALGAVGAWLGCRRKGVPFLLFADAAAPGVAVAQAIGRWGNWFNQELYGRPTDLPWALEIDPAHRPDDAQAVATYHPTFLYESLWNLGVAAVVVLADRRFRLGHGRVFALYLALYTVGRGWIEMLRIDDAHEILGLRLNVWTSLVVFLGAVAFFVFSARRWPGRDTFPFARRAEAPIEPEPEPEPEPEHDLEPEPEPEPEPDPESAAHQETGSRAFFDVEPPAEPEPAQEAASPRPFFAPVEPAHEDAWGLEDADEGADEEPAQEQPSATDDSQDRDAGGDELSGEEESRTWR